MTFKLTKKFARLQHERLWRASPPAIYPYWNVILMNTINAIDGDSTYEDWLEWEIKEQDYVRFWRGDFNQDTIYNNAKNYASFDAPISISINNTTLTDWTYDAIGFINVSISSVALGRTPAMRGDIGTDAGGTFFLLDNTPHPDLFNPSTGDMYQSSFHIFKGSGAALDPAISPLSTYSQNTTETNLNLNNKIYLQGLTISTPSTGNILAPPSITSSQGMHAMYLDYSTPQNLLAGESVSFGFDAPHGFGDINDYLPSD